MGQTDNVTYEGNMSVDISDRGRSSVRRISIDNNEGTFPSESVPLTTNTPRRSSRGGSSINLCQFAAMNTDVDPEKVSLASDKTSSFEKAIQNNNNILPIHAPPKNKAPRTGWRKYIGIIFALSSSFVFSLGSVLVKLLNKYHPFSVTLWRFQGILWPAIPILLYCRFGKSQPVFDCVLPLTQPGKLKTLALLCLRGFMGCGAVIFHFYSLQYINIADSSVISFSTPVFVTVIAHIFLGEKCGIVPIFTAILTIIGVGVIARPPLLTGKEEFDMDTLTGAGFALACMVLAAFTMVLVRYLRQVHYSFITAFFGVWGTLECLVLACIVVHLELPKGTQDWLYAAGLAALTFIGQSCITLALKFEQAGPVSLIRTCDVLFAFVWQLVFLGVLPDIFSIIGATIIISGVLIVVGRKWITELPEGHPAKAKYWCLLK